MFVAFLRMRGKCLEKLAYVENGCKRMLLVFVAWAAVASDRNTVSATVGETSNRSARNTCWVSMFESFTQKMKP